MVERAQGDIARHRAGWKNFCRFIAWAIAGTVVTLGLMALFLL